MPTSSTEPRFPDASDFSPGIIRSAAGSDLLGLLRLVQHHGGDRRATVAAVRDAYFSTRAEGQQLKSANNPLIALNENNYGLLRRRDLRLTEAGTHIAAAHHEREAVRRFARHILRELCGADLLRAVNALRERGEAVEKVSLARELTVMGYSGVKATDTDHMRMLDWLRVAGVVTEGRRVAVDEEVLFAVAGLRLDTLEEWADLDAPQRAFLRAVQQLSTLYGDQPVEIKAVRELVEDTHGETVWRRADQVPADVIRPLAERGWLVAPRHQGRGARQGETRATDKLLATDLSVLDRQVLDGLPRAVRDALRTPRDTVLAQLAHADRDVAGRALEVLCAQIAVGLGLRGLRLRERASQTGGNEVDLVAESVGRTFARWVFQAKNTTGSIGVNVLAKEVGVATVLQAHVVVLVTRGRFSEDVHRMAAQLARTSPLQAYLIDGSLLERYIARGEAAITKAFREQAELIRRLKEQQLGDAGV